MTPSAERTAKHPTGIAQYVVDVLINLMRFFGPDPAAIVRPKPGRQARQG
ncbi:hypothetical protein [Streptomyces spirodelae]|uniref:Uncharacterized protein n=1 Tax=Streptomyces spirodelae TaxID=2812904 RepID=A0ABS3X3G3_9ACTN|nr:hypothetical protein [Streptomyces spirodelae]MBO8189904.1 hypothetical protein [Streptomyces spirodelae]